MIPEAADDAGAWLEMSRYDLDTAEAMQRSGRYLYVLFCCQQAVEKRLTALVVAKTGKMPPKVHDLLRLAQAAGMSASSEEQRLLAELNGYYVETRYPEALRGVAEQFSEDLAQRCLSRVREYVECLDRQVK